MRLDGTKASAIHEARLCQVSGNAGACPAPSGTFVASLRRRRQATSIVTQAAPTKPPYAIAQTTFCERRGNVGSTIAGYTSSASKLPALLAAYRKYGSRADGSSVSANHRCSSGAVTASAKNGRPIDRARIRSSQPIGCPSAGSGVSGPIADGRAAARGGGPDAKAAGPPRRPGPGG